jgi:hypothetical protein
MNLVRSRRWHSNSQNHSNADAIICQNIWSKPPTVTVKIKDAIQASHVAQLLPQPFPLRSSGFVTVEQLLRRNHEGKPPCDIVRRIVFVRPVYPIATDMWAVFASRSRICFCIHMNSLHPIVPKLLLLKPPWHLEMQSAHRRNQLCRNTSTNQKATNSNCLSPICFLSHVIATA